MCDALKCFLGELDSIKKDLFPPLENPGFLCNLFRVMQEDIQEVGAVSYAKALWGESAEAPLYAKAAYRSVLLGPLFWAAVLAPKKS